MVFWKCSRRYFFTCSGHCNVNINLAMKHATNHGIFRWASTSVGMNSMDGMTSDMKRLLHIPVMPKEVVQILKARDGQVFVDMTIGGGGHARSLLTAAPNIRLFGLDRDPVAYEEAKKLSKIYPQLVPLLGKFSDINKLLAQHGLGENSVDGMLFDIGASSLQFDSHERGFSVSKNASLDMRMDGDRDPEQPSAADVVNYMEEKGLYKVIKCYGEEKNARMIARAIVDTRYAFGKIKTTKQLADIVASVYQIDYIRDKLNRRSHVATKTFQALRTFVNNELNELNNGLEIAHRLLKPGGVCVAISFHSLEDRIIKRHFHDINMDEAFNQSLVDLYKCKSKNYCSNELDKMLSRKWNPLKRKITIPTDEEVENNPRARSAKLRAASKIPCNL